jgi:hypothetical protein
VPDGANLVLTWCLHSTCASVAAERFFRIRWGASDRRVPMLDGRDGRYIRNTGNSRTNYNSTGRRNSSSPPIQNSLRRARSARLWVLRGDVPKSCKSRPHAMRVAEMLICVSSPKANFLMMHEDSFFPKELRVCPQQRRVILTCASRPSVDLLRSIATPDDVRCHDRSRVGRLGDEQNPKRPNPQPGYSPCIQSAGCSQARPK